MDVTPDTKDWTWVLERTCEECGFDTRSFPREDIGRLIRDDAARWPALLSDPRARERPSPARWSGLEYACHVRDVYELYDHRLRLMLDEDDPLFPNWDQDTTAVEKDYGREDPDTVARELAANAEGLAARFDGVDGHQWERQGRRSDGAAFTVETFARYLIHDPIHHVHDVELGYRMLSAEEGAR